MRIPIITLGFLLSSIGTGAVAGTCVDGQTCRTRQQARSEPAKAIRSGSILAPGQDGLTLRELHPHRYPAVSQGVGKSLDEVNSETRHAIRQGDIQLAGESGATLRQQFPSRYPAAPTLAVRTRAQVVAELREAIRAGDLLPAGEGSLTSSGRNPQRYAKLRPALPDSPLLGAAALGNSTR